MSGDKPIQSIDGSVTVLDVVTGTNAELKQLLDGLADGLGSVADEARERLEMHVERDPLTNHITTAHEFTQTTEGIEAYCVVCGFGAPSALFGNFLIVLEVASWAPEEQASVAICDVAELLAKRAFAPLLNPDAKCACCGKEAH